MVNVRITGMFIPAIQGGRIIYGSNGDVAVDHYNHDLVPTDMTKYVVGLIKKAATMLSSSCRS
ncbi:hypothetical protein BDE02_04G014900 [Populus trichocarpa]|nr:hypothetical protein BDE02_04G014900 [Populus trichocarpa]